MVGFAAWVTNYKNNRSLQKNHRQEWTKALHNYHYEATDKPQHKSITNEELQAIKNAIRKQARKERFIIRTVAVITSIIVVSLLMWLIF